MKKLLSLGAVVFLICIAAISLSGNRKPSDTSRIHDRFIGAWRLASLEEEGSAGKIHKADCTGLLVLTRDGHMSVQVMFKNPPVENSGTNATNFAPVQYSQGGYEASFGTYKIDESTQTFTFHVDGALVRSLVGKDLKRAFEFSGKQLFVKSANPAEHWRATWERN